MNENTVIVYESSIGKITFAYNSPFWIVDMEGVSGIDIDISESQSNEQILRSLPWHPYLSAILTMIKSV